MAELKRLQHYKALVNSGLIKLVHDHFLEDFVYSVSFKVRPESISQLQASALTTGCLEALGQAPGSSSSVKPLPMFIKVCALFRIFLSGFP